MPTVDLDAFKKFSDGVRKSAESKYVTFGSAGELTLIPSHIPYGIPSGLPQMDWAIGRNGYPAGRIIELWGFEMSGKSAAAMAAMAGVQSIGGYGCWIETEHTLDPGRLQRAGVDLERMIIAECDTIEGIFKTQNEILDQREKAGMTEPFLFVVDSIGAVTSEMEHDRLDMVNSNKQWNTSQVGVDAKQTKGLLRILNSRLARSQCTTLFVNHGTETANASPYAKKGKAGGGHAIKFYASLRCEFTKISNIKDEDVENRIAGQNIKVTLEKVKGTSMNRTSFEASLMDGLFDPMKGLYEAMLGCGLIYRAKGSQTAKLDPGEGEEHIRTFKPSEFANIVTEMGGYSAVYNGWLNWSKEKGLMKLWGTI